MKKKVFCLPMISQTSSSPTARRNPYTCQDNLKLLSFLSIFSSFCSSFSKNSPYKSLSVPAYERDGMPPFYQKFWSPFWRTPHLNNMPTSLSDTTTSRLIDFSRLFTHPVVNVVCAPKQVENEPQDQKAQAGTQRVIH